MTEIGRMATLAVVKHLDFGMYLDGGQLGEILLPTRYIPDGVQIGDAVDVFLYLDSEDRLLATTETPYVMVGQFAHLYVKDTNKAGAFLDWGLPKDLFVPFKEQQSPMQPGKSYTVCVYRDASGRIAASSKLHSFFEEENFDDFTVGEEVELHIASRSDLGYKAIINGTHLGLIHKADVFQDLALGQELTGYIKNLREDGRIDISLQPPIGKAIESLSQKILDHLQAHGGSSPITDKSPPEVIYKEFGASKANFKRALGALYKEKRIELTKDKILLMKG